jgi:hypothetical protein
VLPGCRDGAGRVTSSVKRCGAEAPQLCSIIPPGEEIGFVRREPQAIWRFAPGRCAQTEVYATAEKVGRGVGQGYFA